MAEKKDIIDLLYEKNRVSVAELAKTLYVSEMTIRRDLNQLEKMGMLKRYRGGAVLALSEDGMPISRRFFVDESEKLSLSKKAEKFLDNNLTVYIDSSSTCHYIIPFIKKFQIYFKPKKLLVAIFRQWGVGKCNFPAIRSNLFD